MKIDFSHSNYNKKKKIYKKRWSRTELNITGVSRQALLMIIVIYNKMKYPYLFNYACCNIVVLPVTYFKMNSKLNK